jgi:hypothetical protein
MLPAHRLRNAISAMRLDDGDVVSFALPGHPDTRFSVARDFDAVTVTSMPAARPDRTASL